MFFKFISTSTTGVLQTFGKFTKTVGPGLQLYVPFIQKITPVSNRLTQDTFKFEVKTKDNVFATLELAVQYKISPDNTEKAFFSLDDPKKQIDAYIENVVRSRTPRMKLDELFESQNDICRSVSEELSGKMKDYGYTIENTLVTGINPATAVKEAMNNINASERLMEAARNEADAQFIKKVREAEADRDRKELQGKGIALQRRAIFEGYEVGVQNMANTLGLSPQQIIDFITKVQHLDTLEGIGKSSNAKTIFIQHEPQNSISNKFMQANEVD
jgi:regulator of protease activity HflC (stomatin/prohibitin superfamily)